MRSACTKCGGQKGVNRHRSWCAACLNAAAKQSRVSFPDANKASMRKWRETARGRAVSLIKYCGRRHDLVTINVEWVLRKILAGHCELSGLAFDLHARGGRSPYTPSLDRKIAELGYTPENTRVVVWCVNAALGTWGDDTLKVVVEALHGKL